MPGVFDATFFAKTQVEASLLLDVRLQQMFRRTGTGIAVRIVVFAKVPTASTPAITGDTCELTALHTRVAKLSPRAQTSASHHRPPVVRPLNIIGKQKREKEE